MMKLRFIDHLHLKCFNYLFMQASVSFIADKSKAMKRI